MSLRVSITAKMNRMAIAPMYTTTCTTARKLALSRAKITATLNNVAINHNAAWTRLRVVTTIKPEPSVANATTRKVICSPVILYPLRINDGLSSQPQALALQSFHVLDGWLYGRFPVQPNLLLHSIRTCREYRVGCP